MMLDSWIIEELKRREQRESEQERRPRPVLELPLDPREDPSDDSEAEGDESERGVVIIDL